MEHFLYVVEELSGESDVCSAAVLKELYMSGDAASRHAKAVDERAAVELDYDMNATVSSINKIMDYYGIPTRHNKKELRKADKIKRVVDFEMDKSNSDVVKKRKLHWDYISELKKDDYFKKYIAFDL